MQKLLFSIVQQHHCGLKYDSQSALLLVLPFKSHGTSNSLCSVYLQGNKKILFSLFVSLQDAYNIIIGHQWQLSDLFVCSRGWLLQVCIELRYTVSCSLLMSFFSQDEDIAFSVLGCFSFPVQSEILINRILCFCRNLYVSAGTYLFLALFVQSTDFSCANLFLFLLFVYCCSPFFPSWSSCFVCGGSGFCMCVFLFVYSALRDPLAVC